MDQKIVAFQEALDRFCQSRGFEWWKAVEVYRAQVYEVRRPTKVFMYVKQNANRPRWWGIGKNIYAKLRSLKQPWSMVLLIGHGESGYALSSTEVSAMISGLSYNDHDYIVKEKDATEGFPFSTFDAIFQHLLL
jgi:hypothetical protein